MFREWEVTVRTVAFTLREMERHWRVVNRGVKHNGFTEIQFMCHTIHPFKKVFLVDLELCNYRHNKF